MELIVLDEQFRSTEIIDNYESLIWTDRYGKAGDFEIYVPASMRFLNALKHDYYIWLKESEHVMIIENHYIKQESDGTNNIVITGRSLESILDRRIVWEQTVLTGKLESAVEKLLNDAIINPTDTSRKIENFIFRPSNNLYISSLKIDAQYTGDNLYDVIVDICKANEIGFKIILEDNQFIFQLYYGADRSYNQIKNPYIIFSPKFENLLNSSYLESKTNLKTITLIGGEGEGSKRIFATKQIEEADGIKRRELFTDARDISKSVSGKTLTDAEYKNQLIQRGTEKLAECIFTQSFDGKIDSNALYQYGVDFFMGDIVQVENDYGNETKSRVTEMIYSHDRKGIDCYPSFTATDKDDYPFPNGTWYLEVFSPSSESYPTPTYCNGKTPVNSMYGDYNDVKSSHPWGTPENSFTARYTQWVNCSKEISQSMTITTDDNGCLYVNDSLVITNASCAVTTFTLKLEKGWNKVELLYNEGSGGDYGYLSVDLATLDGVLRAIPTKP